MGQPPNKGEMYLRGLNTEPSTPNPQELLLPANQPALSWTQ